MGKVDQTHIKETKGEQRVGDGAHEIGRLQLLSHLTAAKFEPALSHSKYLEFLTESGVRDF